MHKEAPVVFGSMAIGRLADGTAYPRVYLKGNETQWLDVIRKNNHVILKEDFDNTGFTSTNQVACVHDERTWQVFVTQMAKDTEVCDHETTGGIVSRVWMKKKGVIAFVLYHSGSNHKEYCFWVFRAPQNGFSVIVR